VVAAIAPQGRATFVKLVNLRLLFGVTVRNGLNNRQLIWRDTG
jgi:hypothetical protein